jgi:hypothetical protein
MDKETESSLQQMMARFLAEIEARAEAPQEKEDAEAKARHERFLAFLDGLTSRGKGTTTCQTETTSCPEEMEVEQDCTIHYVAKLAVRLANTTASFYAVL